MSFTRRFAASGIALILFGCGLSIAQPSVEPSEGIPNWSAPPYWSPQKSSPELSGVRPQEVEGVPTPALAFTGITPCRVADTRGNGFTGQYGPPSLAAGSPRNFTLGGQCGVAGGAEAISLNITVTNTQGPGFILIYPQGGAQPSVSTLNYVANQTIANAAVVPLGSGGGVTVIAGVSGTDLIIDTNGYYAPQAVVNTVNGLSGDVTLAPGANVTITPSGQTLTIAASGGAPGWSLTGNAGTTPGTNFVGATDNQALEIKVNSQRIFRLEPNATSPSVIGGHADNNALAGVLGATIGGGGAAGQGNVVTDHYGTVGGGRSNQAGDNQGTLFDRPWATVSGGLGNIASGQESFVGGGNANVASGQTSTVGGGFANNASGGAATIPGGNQNSAGGFGSFAAGSFAHANHEGAFVWGDSSVLGGVSSTANNQFIVRAAGGMWLGTTSLPSFDIATDFLRTSTGAHLTIGGVWTNNSDRDSKENFQEIDAQDVLSRVATLPITRWNYKAEGCEVEHIGPMAQDFAAAFGVGSDDRSIGTLDSSGVALAAIQALYEMAKEKDAEIAALKARLSDLESRLP